MEDFCEGTLLASKGDRALGGRDRSCWEILGDAARRAFRSKTLRFCSSTSGVLYIGGRTGREKLFAIGLTMGILPAWET